MRHIFKIDDGEQHWVSADDERDALRWIADDYGTVDQYVADCEPKVTRLDDDELLGVYLDHPYRDPTARDVKPCREWAAERAGVIATSCE